MTWIGDGGSSTGVFHEGLNFAATQKAPFVLILENNLWAYSTPVRKQVPLENLADRAKAYGIDRSEEHTSELQSQSNLVCRLLLEKKKKTDIIYTNSTE